MNFGSPQVLWVLAAGIPALGCFLWWTWRQKQRLAASFIANRLRQQLLSGYSAFRQKLRLAFVAIAAVLILIALARPRWGYGLEEARQRGLDIVVAIDTSRSMLAEDVTPNRLERAKLAALDLKRLARTDRMGLVAFAGSAFLQCPLSLDDDAFRQSVEALDTKIIPQGGTALAEAIETARQAFKEETGNHQVLVLFTDGEDHDSAALDAAKSSAKAGLRLFTIGVGSANGELLATRDPFGNRVFIKDDQGNVVKSRLNESLLRELAQAGQGFYLPLTGAHTMDALYERGLAPLPKADFKSRTVRLQFERFQWFLAAAIVLVLMEMLTPERLRRRSRPASVLAGSAVTTVLMLLGLGVPATASAESPSSASRQYRAGRYERAETEFEALARRKPEDARLNYNAGAAAFKSGNYDKALNHFSISLASPDLRLQEKAYYNLGNTRFRLGEQAKEPKERQALWEQATNSFASALKLSPTNADAMYNLELVRRKIEELKQQQPPPDQSKDQNKDQNKDQDKDKNEDKNKDQSKDKQSSSDKDKQDKQDQQDQQDKSEQQKQNQSGQPDPKDQKPDSAQNQQSPKPGEDKPPAPKPRQQDDKKDQPGAQQGREGQDGQENDDQQSAGKPMRLVRMTPQQAMQLLDAQRSQEKPMIFQQQLRTNRQPRGPVRDW